MSRMKDITVRAGQDIKIAVPIKGWPLPTTTWSNTGNELEKDDRTKMEVSRFTRQRKLVSY